MKLCWQSYANTWEFYQNNVFLHMIENILYFITKILLK